MIDVVIVDGSERHAAELRDVGLDGVGLVLIPDTVCLRNGASGTIEFDETSGVGSPLSGHFKVERSPIPYRPNIRSAGFCIDSTCRDILEVIMHECTGASPEPTAEFGFLRAWNMLNVVERATLKKSFGTLRAMNADTARIIDNLLSDPNCSATRLLNLMRVFLRVLHTNSGVCTFPVFKDAFDVYRLEHSLEDTQKDKLIKYELGFSRLATV
jgi:hypothetical protein